MHSPTTDESLQCVRVAMPPDVADLIFELIDQEDFVPSIWHDVEQELCSVTLIPDTPLLLKSTLQSLQTTAQLIGVKVEPTVVSIKKQEWSEVWKEFFHVERISPRIVVRPSWESYLPQAGESVITLDPGMSFGTGKHGTTQACLQFLDQLAVENTCRSVTDMGCGSGILAIGATLLGFESVVGFDNDPECIKVSQENAAVNMVSPRFYLGDLSVSHAPTDIVVANILASVLVEYVANILATLKPGTASRLVLSGILDTQYIQVQQAYCKAGMQEVDSILIGEWRSGLFRWSNKA